MSGQTWVSCPYFTSNSSAHSLRGSRQENQDSYLLIDECGGYRMLQEEKNYPGYLSSWSKDYLRLAVADGMGGHAYGRQVAETLVMLLKDTPPISSKEMLAEAIHRIHASLYQKFNPHGVIESPGSTLVWAEINRQTGEVFFANVGDSRIYLWRKGHWQALTHDHVAEEFDWREEVLKNENLPPPPAKHGYNIAQAMGCGSFALIADADGRRPLRPSPDIRLDMHGLHSDIQQIQLQDGDVLALASDGLWDHLPEEVECLPPLADKLAYSDLVTYVKDAVQQAWEQGSKDNITLLAAHFKLIDK